MGFKTILKMAQKIMANYVGLSLSFCVGSILRGEVQLSEVEKIVSSTACFTPESWDGVITNYRNSYWSKNPDKGEQIARHLINSGKIIQPRLGESLGQHAQFIPLMDGGVVALGEIDSNWIDANKGTPVTF